MVKPRWAGVDKDYTPLYTYNNYISGQGYFHFIEQAISSGMPDSYMIDDFLRKEKEKAGNYLEAVGCVVVVIDVSQTVRLINKKACETLGWEEAEIIGKNWFDNFIPEIDREKTREVFKKLMAGDTQLTEHFENDILAKSGQVKTIAWNNAVLKNLSGAIIATLSFGYDITERKNSREKIEALNKKLVRVNSRLKQLIMRDSQTGLYNHRYLEDTIETEFARSQRLALPLSLIMLDVDYFKSVNDVYGHKFGDLVIKQLAHQLKSLVRRYDILVRFGGEEFVILCPITKKPDALAVAERMLYATGIYNFGNKYHSIKIKLTASVVSYPEDAPVIKEGAELINLADDILNKAKEKGGNRVYSRVDVKEETDSSREKSAQGASDVEALKGEINKLTTRSNQSVVEAMIAFAKTIEAKDRYTGEHAERTVSYATEIANILGLSKPEKNAISQAAALHDLGKIGISEKILSKKTKLTKKEFQEIKKHPQLGIDILRPIQFMHDIIPYILYHHERWDGNGYPFGLKGEQIPVGARVIAIADVYQALTSDRPYRKALPKKQAIRIIKEGSGTHFDPNVVDAFLNVLKTL